MVEARVGHIHRRLLLAQEAGRIGTYEIDLATGLASGSPRFLAIFGFPPDFGEVSTAQWMERVHPDDRATATDHMRRLLRSAEAGNTGEYRVLVNGCVRWVYSCDQVDRNSDGRAIRAFGAIQDVTERKDAEAWVWHAAHHDALTGLPNRLNLNEAIRLHLENARSQARPAGLLLFDLDKLKQANDRHGHAAGDALLVTVANAIASAATAAGGTAARIGGDEFAIIAPLNDRGTLPMIARKVAVDLNQPLRFGEVILSPAVSAGGACYPDQGSDKEGLMRNADMALCVAKQSGRGRCLIYSDVVRKKFEDGA